MSSLCFAALSATSQTEEKKWNVGFHGGITQYNGDRGMNFYTTNQASYGFAGVSISRYLSDHFDASLFFTRGEVGNTEALSPWSPANDPNHFNVRLNTANLVIRFNILPSRYVVRPYLYAGIGGIMHEGIFGTNKERFDYALPSFGGGLNFRMGKVVSLQLEESFMYSTTDAIDHTVGGGSNDGYLYHKVGLTFNIGKKQDADKDGVSDKKDKCGNTPSGVAVDAVGCPLDRDADGVADYMDACVDVAGIASLKGCPDADLDGLTDNEDRCPTIAGSVQLKGCPDADADGIADIDDKCPGTKAGYKVDGNGCTLDNDKDGVVNEEDVCPELAGVLVFKGCPDTDGDGVSDNNDLCPAIKGTIENKGCPEMAKEDIVKITVIASKIYFETGSDKLKLISNSQLDDLVIILNRYSSINLTIEGHTDNVGDDTYNQELSQKRTLSVKNYLVSKGVSEKRLNAIGYGEAKPIADNKNASGKAKNRRVELKTSY